MILLPLILFYCAVGWGSDTLQCRYLGLLKMFAGLVNDTIFFSFIVVYWKTLINFFDRVSFIGNYSAHWHTPGTLHFKLFSIVHIEASYLLTIKMIMEKWRLGCGVQYSLLLTCQKILVTYTCFDILIRISICCISLPWKAVFKSVFNIMLLRPYILRSCIL